MGDDVMIAVDPHKASNTAAVLDPVTKTLIETGRFANDADGYVQLTRSRGGGSTAGGRWRAVMGRAGRWRSGWSRTASRCWTCRPSWPPGCWCTRAGMGARPTRTTRSRSALAALDGTGVFPATSDDATVSLRLLCGRREELGALRTQAACRLHRLLAELTPGGMRRELSAAKAEALLAKIRPGDDVAKVRLQIARDHLADICALDARLKTIGGHIAALVTASGTTLTSLYGIGPVIAGRILAETGDIARFTSKDKFASYNGTAPIDVSSGDQVRHRLSRSGNRRMNHALHMMAVTQIRNQGSPGRKYYERKPRRGQDLERGSPLPETTAV